MRLLGNPDREYDSLIHQWWYRYFRYKPSNRLILRLGCVVGCWLPSPLQSRRSRWPIRLGLWLVILQEFVPNHHSLAQNWRFLYRDLPIIRGRFWSYGLPYNASPPVHRHLQIRSYLDRPLTYNARRKVAPYAPRYHIPRYHRAGGIYR